MNLKKSLILTTALISLVALNTSVRAAEEEGQAGAPQRPASPLQVMAGDASDGEASAPPRPVLPTNQMIERTIAEFDTEREAMERAAAALQAQEPRTDQALGHLGLSFQELAVMINRAETRLPDRRAPAEGDAEEVDAPAPQAVDGDAGTPRSHAASDADADDAEADRRSHVSGDGEDADDAEADRRSHVSGDGEDADDTEADRRSHVSGDGEDADDAEADRRSHVSGDGEDVVDAPAPQAVDGDAGTPRSHAASDADADDAEADRRSHVSDDGEDAVDAEAVRRSPVVGDAEEVDAGRRSLVTEEHALAQIQMERRSELEARIESLQTSMKGLRGAAYGRAYDQLAFLTAQLASLSK